MACLLVLCCLGFIGCTDAEWQHTWNYGQAQQITLYSGGKEVGQWVSTGKILHSDACDGYLFEDSATCAGMCVHGDVVIINLNQIKR